MQFNKQQIKLQIQKKKSNKLRFIGMSNLIIFVSQISMSVSMCVHVCHHARFLCDSYEETTTTITTKYRRLMLWFCIICGINSSVRFSDHLLCCSVIIAIFLLIQQIRSIFCQFESNVFVHLHNDAFISNARDLKISCSKVFLYFDQKKTCARHSIYIIINYNQTVSKYTNFWCFVFCSAIIIIIIILIK